MAVGGQPVTVNSQDPTSSKTLRDSFISDFYTRWRAVRGQNREWLESHSNIQRSGMQTDYRRFFENVAGSEVLEQLPDRRVLSGQHWTGKRIRAAYDKGLRLAAQDLRSFDAPDSQVERATRRNQLQHQKRLESEYEKVYFTVSDHVTLAVSKVSDVFRTAVENNKPSRWVADRANQELREHMETRYTDTAKTAVVRAINEALLTSYELAGVSEVGVAIEGGSGSVSVNQNFIRTNAAGELVFETADDSKVCAECRALEGTTVQISEVRNRPEFQPPIHPRCRCRLVPTAMELVSEDETIGVPSGSGGLRSRPVQ